MRRSSVLLLVVALAAVLLPSSAAVAGSQTDLATITDPDPVDWTPHITSGGTVKSFAEVGDLIIAGGRFDRVNSEFDRPNLVAFDRTTGAVDPDFAPVLNGEVKSVVAVPGEDAVVVGGFFTEVNGQEQRYLVKLTMDGQIDPTFTAFADRPVYDLEQAQDFIVVAGNFLAIGGTPRPKLAMIDASTGVLRDRLQVEISDKRTTSQTDGLLHLIELDVTEDGSRIVAIGNFKKADGLDRNQVVVIDNSVDPARVDPDWNTNSYVEQCRVLRYSMHVRDVDISPDGQYFVVATTGAYKSPPSLCDTIARFDLFKTGADIAPTWVNYTGGDTLTSAYVTNEAVYAGGHQRWMNNPDAGDRRRAGAVIRDGIAALDPVNGIPLSWNPGRERGYGVGGFNATDEGLWMGHDTRTVAGEYHNKIALFPAGGAPLPRPQPGTLPATALVYRDNGSVGQYAIDAGGTVTDLGDAADDPRLDERDVVAAMRLGDSLWTFEDDRNFYRYDDAGNPREQIDMNWLNIDIFENGNKVYSRWRIEDVTGLTFDPLRGRIWYTMSGDSRLYWRGFTAESGIIGGQRFTITSSSQYGFSDVDGMFLSGDDLYVAKGNGNLDRITFVDSVPVSGSRTTVSGPGVDGFDWRGRALTLDTDAGTQAPNLDPIAAFDTTCSGDDGEVCVFDANSSYDPDGSLVSYDWVVDGLAAGSGVVLEQTFTTEATHTVELTVTDDRGATDVASDTVDVFLAPTATFTVDCTGLTCTFDASGSSDGADPVVSADWDFGDGNGDTGLVVEHTYAAEGNVDVTVTVTDDEAQTASATQTVGVIGPEGDIRLRDVANTNTYSAAPTVTVPTTTLAGDALVLFTSVGTPGLVAGDPTNGDWNLLGARTSNGMESLVWWRIADGDDAGSTVEVPLTTGRKVDLTLAVYDDASDTTPISQWSAIANQTSTASYTTPTLTTTGETLVASYWAQRSSNGTDWTAPAGQQVRSEGIGVGNSHLNTLLTDAGAPSPAGQVGGLTATSDVANNSATSWTIVLSKTDTSGNLAFRGVENTNIWSQNPSVAVPANAADGDTLLLFGSFAAVDLVAGDPSNGPWTLLGRQASGAEETYVWWRQATGADAGTTVTVPLSSGKKADLTLAAYRNANAAAPIATWGSAGASTETASYTTPTVASTVAGLEVSFWAQRSSNTTAWTPPAQVAQRSASFGVGNSYLSTLLTDRGTTTPAGNLGGLTATADSATATASTWTIQLSQADTSGQTDFRGSAISTNTYSSTPEVQVPGNVQAGDLLLLVTSVNRVNSLPAQPTGVGGWTVLDTATNGMQARVWWKIAEAGDAGATVGTPLTRGSKVDVSLVAYRNVDTAAPFVANSWVAESTFGFDHTTPVVATAEGGLVVSYWADQSSNTTNWTEPAGEVNRVESTGVGNGRIGVLITDGGVVAGAGNVGGLTAPANDPTSSGIQWTFVLRPAP